jgi:hypothetical protein
MKNTNSDSKTATHGRRSFFKQARALTAGFWSTKRWRRFLKTRTPIPNRRFEDY